MKYKFLKCKIKNRIWAQIVNKILIYHNQLNHLTMLYAIVKYKRPQRVSEDRLRFPVPTVLAQQQLPSFARLQTYWSGEKA